MSSTIEQNIRKTTDEFVRAYVDAGQARKPSLVSAHNTPDCKRWLGPPGFLVAMGAPHDMPFTNEMYEAEFGEMRIISIDGCEIFNLTVDVGGRKSACRSVMSGTFISGEKYTRSHAWFLDFTEDGMKVKEIYQMNDLQEAREYREKVAKLAKEHFPNES